MDLRRSWLSEVISISGFVIPLCQDEGRISRKGKKEGNRSIRRLHFCEFRRITARYFLHAQLAEFGFKIQELLF